MNINDLEAAMKTAKAQGRSTVPVHIFVLANLLSKFREVATLSEIERDAIKHMERARGARAS